MDKTLDKIRQGSNRIHLHKDHVMVRIKVKVRDKAKVKVSDKVKVVVVTTVTKRDILLVTVLILNRIGMEEEVWETRWSYFCDPKSSSRKT